MNVPFALPEFVPGSVWLVGAGPGDPGLLSLLAMHGLAHADAVVYDALVDARVLDLARPEAERISVGKRGGQPSPKQCEINARLVALAQSGLRVLRLKGGDPFVFGRGAEEAMGLADAGVPFRVVPGVSSGMGGLAYAGIPATSRDTNSAVCLLTGHDAEGKAPAHDWDALARLPVLVFYMALRNLDEISDRLVAAGRDPDEPAAAVSRATTAQQKVVIGTLSGIAATAAAAGVEAPALLVIGKVAHLHQSLDWFLP